jgi:hypothetical protein
MGRNSVFDRAGNEAIALVAGAVGHAFSQRAVFLLVPVFATLTVIAVLSIPARPSTTTEQETWSPSPARPKLPHVARISQFSSFDPYLKSSGIICRGAPATWTRPPSLLKITHQKIPIFWEKHHACLTAPLIYFRDPTIRSLSIIPPPMP